MISKQYTDSLATDILAIDWVDRYGGLTHVVNNGAVFVPVSEDVNAIECFDNNHYKELIPDKDKKGIVYFEEANDIILTPSTHGLYKFVQPLRLVAWINLPKSGFTRTSFDPFYPLHKLITVKTLNVSGIGLRSIESLKILKRENVIKNVFGRYKYQSELYALCSWPYTVFAIEFNLVGTLDQSCLPTNAGSPEIVCPS